jgi:hypothetical protein
MYVHTVSDQNSKSYKINKHGFCFGAMMIVFYELFLIKYKKKKMYFILTLTCCRLKVELAIAVWVKLIKLRPIFNIFIALCFYKYFY